MCSECGAPDDACQARFDECLAREFMEPAYGRVHNLTVSTFIVQHSSRLTREGWLYERDLLREFIVEGRSPEQVRTERKDLLDSGQRKFKITSRDGKPVLPPMHWAKTILDVRLDDPATYCEDVTAWARATVADSEKIAL